MESEALRVFCLLQNAWSPVYAGRVWPRESWLAALHASRSGTRLGNFAWYLKNHLRYANTARVLEGEEPVELSIHYDNTTPQVGATPDSKLPPDFSYVRRQLQQADPHLIVAWGNQAHMVMQYLRTIDDAAKKPTLLLPHPTYRLLPTYLLQAAAYKLWETPSDVRLSFEGVVQFKMVGRQMKEIVHE